VNRRIMENLPIALKEYINDFTVGPKKHWKKIYNNCLNLDNYNYESDRKCVDDFRKKGFYPLAFGVITFPFYSPEQYKKQNEREARQKKRLINYFESLFPSSIPDWMFSYYEDEDFSYYENEKMVKF